MRSEPVFLYNDPHPVHELMARRVGAQFVECAKGGPIERLRAARAETYGDRPVLIEGGVPLLEAGLASLFRRTGPIIELAADATLIDLQTPLPGRSRSERLAHRFGETQVDATLAVSDTLAAYARLRDRPVRVIHPFVLDEKYERLIELSPGGEGRTIVCIGKRNEKNGQDILLEAISRLDLSVTAHFVGPGTDTIEEGRNVQAHGFVTLDSFVNLLDRADLMVYPARVGAYPVAILEALVAATPVVTTPYVGNAELVRALDPGFVTEPNPKSVEAAIDRAFDSTLSDIGQRARAIGRPFTAARQLDELEGRFNEIITLLHERRL